MDGGTSSRRGAGLLAAGFALGVILPRLVGALRPKSSSEKSSTAGAPLPPPGDPEGLLGEVDRHARGEGRRVVFVLRARSRGRPPGPPPPASSP
ncbi:hypothetical protein THAOC_16924, partial [Thalassiosira oceanica]